MDDTEFLASMDLCLEPTTSKSMQSSKQSAVRNGLGWKIVDGRPNRRYTSKEAVSKAVEAAGFNPYEKKLIGIIAIQKMLEKPLFEELLAAYIEKLQGKPTLVLENDKRPAMNTAKNDFMEEYDNE